MKGVLSGSHIKKTCIRGKMYKFSIQGVLPGPVSSASFSPQSQMVPCRRYVYLEGV